MKRLTGIFEGEKIELSEELKNDKIRHYLYLLQGHDVIKININEGVLLDNLKAIPEREHIKLKILVQTFKDEIYLNALELLQQKSS